MELTKEDRCIRSCQLVDPQLPELVWHLNVYPNSSKFKDGVVINLNLSGKGGFEGAKTGDLSLNEIGNVKWTF